MTDPEITAQLAAIQQHLANIDMWLGKINGRVTVAEDRITNLRIEIASIAAIGVAIGLVLKVIF